MAHRDDKKPKKIRVIKKAQAEEKTAPEPSNDGITPIQRMIDRRRLLMRELNKIEKWLKPN